MRGAVIVPDFGGGAGTRRHLPADDRGGGSSDPSNSSEPSNPSRDKTQTPSVEQAQVARKANEAALVILNEEKQSVLDEIAKTKPNSPDVQDLKEWLRDLDEKIKSRQSQIENAKNTPAKKSKDGPEVGKSLNSQKQKIPKAKGKVVPLLLRENPDHWIGRVAEWLDTVRAVKDPDGEIVLVANPENGSLIERALHLIGSYRKDDIYKQGERDLRSDKAKTVFLIPQTIQDYQVKAEDGNHGLAYIRRYEDGTLHMVIVEKNTRKLQDHGLITQRSLDASAGAKSLVIIKTREASN